MIFATRPRSTLAIQVFAAQPPLWDALLVETVHAIGARAERRVEMKVINELKKVTGKRRCCTDRL